MPSDEHPLASPRRPTCPAILSPVCFLLFYRGREKKGGNKSHDPSYIPSYLGPCVSGPRGSLLPPWEKQKEKQNSNRSQKREGKFGKEREEGRRRTESCHVRGEICEISLRDIDRHKKQNSASPVEDGNVEKWNRRSEKRGRIMVSCLFPREKETLLAESSGSESQNRPSFKLPTRLWVLTSFWPGPDARIEKKKFFFWERRGWW